MRTITIAFIGILVLCISPLSMAAVPMPSPSPQPMTAAGINQILSEFGEDVNIGMVVQNLQNGAVLYERNPTRYFAPGSNQKLLTAYAALNYLGPAFRYQTQLFVDPTHIHNGIYTGNIYLRFTGDPLLTRNDLDSMFNKLHAAGVETIQGKLVLDDTTYDQGYWPPGSTWDEQKDCTGAPITALMIDHNCITLKLPPNTPINGRANLQAKTTPWFANIESHAVTSSTSHCEPHIHAYSDNSYLITGCVSPNRDVNLAIQSPRLYARDLIINLLKKNNIQLSQGMALGIAPGRTNPWLVHYSEPLSTLVARMFKDSDNLIANSLFKTLGSRYARGQGNWKNSSKALQVILDKNLPTRFLDAALRDGAGASRYTQITPRQLCSLLAKGYQQQSIASNFVNALPLGGIDTNSRASLKDPDVINRIRAKNGSESSVSALSGYVQTPDHQQTLAFVMIINGFLGPMDKYRELQDRICTYLAGGKE